MGLGELFTLLIDAAGLAVPTTPTSEPKEPAARRRFRLLRNLTLFFAAVSVVFGAIAIFRG